MKPKTKKELVESAVKKIVLKNKLSENLSYYQRELGKIQIDSEYSPQVQIQSGEGGGKTKWMAISRETIPYFRLWFDQIESKLPR